MLLLQPVPAGGEREKEMQGKGCGWLVACGWTLWRLDCCPSGEGWLREAVGFLLGGELVEMVGTQVTVERCFLAG